MRRNARLSDSETDDSSGSGEEQSQLEQPQTYPPNKNQVALSQLPPATPKKTETYMIANKESLPEGSVWVLYVIFI